MFKSEKMIYILIIIDIFNKNNVKINVIEIRFSNIRNNNVISRLLKK